VESPYSCVCGYMPCEGGVIIALGALKSLDLCFAEGSLFPGACKRRCPHWQGFYLHALEPTGQWAKDPELSRKRQLNLGSLGEERRRRGKKKKRGKNLCEKIASLKK